jgi:hypothetical protein
MRHGQTRVHATGALWSPHAFPVPPGVAHLILMVHSLLRCARAIITALGQSRLISVFVAQRHHPNCWLELDAAAACPCQQMNPHINLLDIRVVCLPSVLFLVCRCSLLYSTRLIAPVTTLVCSATHSVHVPWKRPWQQQQLLRRQPGAHGGARLNRAATTTLTPAPPRRTRRTHSQCHATEGVLCRRARGPMSRELHTWTRLMAKPSTGSTT